MNLNLSDHATKEISRRNIRIEDIMAVFQAPQQLIPVRPGRQIYQSLIEMDGKQYLLRLIVDEGAPPTLVTVYRTSKIQKSWR